MHATCHRPAVGSHRRKTIVFPGFHCWTQCATDRIWDSSVPRPGQPRAGQRGSQGFARGTGDGILKRVAVRPEAVLRELRRRVTICERLCGAPITVTERSLFRTSAPAARRGTGSSSRAAPSAPQLAPYAVQEQDRFRPDRPHIHRSCGQIAEADCRQIGRDLEHPALEPVRQGKLPPPPPNLTREGTFTGWINQSAAAPSETTRRRAMR